MALMVLGPLDTGTDPLSPRERVDPRGTDRPPRQGRRAGRTRGRALGRAAAGHVGTAGAQCDRAHQIAPRARDSSKRSGSEYRLAVDLESIDAVRFERLISTARRHALHGDDDRSVDAYVKALALWRGAPLPEARTWEPGSAEAARLIELHTSARRGAARRTSARRRGPWRHRRKPSSGFARRRCARTGGPSSPWRTIVPTARPMPSPYFAPRERELDDELGIEPGPRITDLETAILRHDPAARFAAHEPGERILPVPGLVPFGPEDAESFFGRDADIEAVSSRAATRDRSRRSPGRRGCGKSSLLLAGVIPDLRRRGRSVEVHAPWGRRMSALTTPHPPEAGLDVLGIDQAEELIAWPTPQTSSHVLRTGRGVPGAWRRRGPDTPLGLPRPDRGSPVHRLALGRGIYLLTGSGSDRACATGDRRSSAASQGCDSSPDSWNWCFGMPRADQQSCRHLSHALVETWVRREGTRSRSSGYERRVESAARSRAPRSVHTSRCRLSEQVACRSILRDLSSATPPAYPSPSADAPHPSSMIRCAGRSPRPSSPRG